MSENRKRDVTLTIRLTAAEKDAIVRNAAKAHMSLTDFLVASALTTEIHVAEDTRPLITELKRIGNNLNQIAVKAHTLNVLDVQRYDEACRKIDTAIKKITEAVILPRPMK